MPISLHIAADDGPVYGTAAPVYRLAIKHQSVSLHLCYVGAVTLTRSNYQSVASMTTTREVIYSCAQMTDCSNVLAGERERGRGRDLQILGCRKKCL